MSWQGTVLVTPTLLAMGLAVILGGYALSVFWNGRRDSLVVLFICITVAIVIWTGFSALKLLRTDPATKLLLYRLLHVGVAALSPLVFLFVVAYTDRTAWLRPTVVGGVFTLPAVFVGLLFSNPAGAVIAGTEVIDDGLVVLRVIDGPGFYLLAFYSVVFVLAALALVAQETRRIGASYYPQAALIGLGVTAPGLFSALMNAGVPPFAENAVNLVPTAGAISVGALGLLLFRYRLFGLPPLAYATAMKHSPDAVFVLDQGARVVHANERGRELLDTLGGDLGSSLPDVIPGFDSSTSSEPLLELENEPGESTYYRVFAETLTRGGRRVGQVVVLRDETTQQRRQRELEQQNDRMELFASTISHDLRNPLNVAQLNLELAQEEGEGDALDRIESAHARMEEIIDTLLLLARQGKQIDDPQQIQLSTVADNAWDNVETVSGELTVQCNGTIVADPAMLQHVFENLFQNSIEHGSNEGSGDGSTSPTEQGGSDVNVRVGDLPDGFFVADDGPGIPAADREAVLHAGYSTSSDGTGLGLKIVETVVDAHGWTLTVTASENGGARFEITGVDRVDE